MNAAIMITARLKSTRLPMKVVKPILGRPMICHMLDRLKLVRSSQKIIICTSTLVQDDPLEKIAAQESVYCFRGHPEDVLLRLTDAACHFGIDTVISCTADNPFVDPVYISRLIDFHMQEGNDFSKIEGLPFGTFSYVLSHRAMIRACEIKDETDTEVWGGYFTDTGVFKVGILYVTDPEVRRPNLRLTVDTPEDFELASRIFQALHIEGRVFTLREILRLFDEHPELARLNAHVQQKPAKPTRVKPSKERDVSERPFHGH